MFTMTLLTLFACEPEKIVVPQDDNTTDTLTDLDGDGYLSDVDCDDNDATTYPDGTEVCDGIDNNCDGVVDEGVLIEYFADADGDGFGNGDISIEACSQQDGFVPNGNDCDDAEPTVFPGAIEECDGLDNDCNDIVDDGNDVVVYFDADGDGFGDPDTMNSTCTAGEGYVENYLDCNDQNNTINPDADELCDSIDNDCDGLIDNEALDAIEWYRDVDNDGYGDDNDIMSACLIPSGYAAVGGDCDDMNSSIHPFAAEVCDEIDQDCDGLTDEGTNNTFFEDSDGDGYGNFFVYIETCTPPVGYVPNAQDCNDTNPAVSPDALEYCNGYDDNCDTMVDENTAVDVVTWYADVDGDGFGDSAVPVEACQAPPFYVADDTDCNDGRPNVFPGATETCTTAYDDDCDGNNNDDGATGCLEYFEDVDGDGYGLSSSSQCLCVPEGDFQSLSDSDCDDTLATVNPGMIENCTTVYDDNCNTDTNEAGGAGCTYFYQDYDGDGYGTTDRVCMCDVVGDYEALVDGDCDDLNAMYSPAAVEVCDANDVDENCDGVADGADAFGATDWFFDGDLDGYGNPNVNQTQCDQPNGYIAIGGDCADTLSSINPGMSETCFTLDDDDCSGSNNDEGAVGCSDFFLDNDGDGYGLSNDTRCLCVAEVPYASVSSGDCDDTRDVVSPGRIETCDLSDVGLPQDEDCDGDVDEANAENCIVYHYDYDGDDFGIGSDSICMCDPDGYYRSTVGGDCEDTDASINPDQSNCGLMGDITADSAAIVISGLSYSNARTKSMVGNFDYNNDGVMDIAVVDPNFDTQYTDAGALFIYLGPLENSVDITAGTADLMFAPDIASEFLGRYSGISVGNIDSDAADEIVVSGVNNSYVIDDNLQGQVTLNEQSSGVTVYSGINSGSGAEAMHILGDLNSDGYPDVVRKDDEEQLLYWGDINGGFITAQQSLRQHNYYSDISSRNAISDVNNDGVPEWVGPSTSCGYSSSMNLCIAQYDSLSGQFVEHRISDAGHYEHGAVAIGDINGDGFDDIVSTNSRKTYYDTFRGNTVWAGQVWVFYGSVNGITVASEADADWTAYGYYQTLYFGIDVDIVDVNNDGFDDILIGSDKATFLYYGPLQTYTDQNGNPRDAYSSDADAIFPHLANRVANVGDQNLDGYDDIMIGADCSSSNHNGVSVSGACAGGSRVIRLFYGAEN